MRKTADRYFRYSQQVVDCRTTLMKAREPKKV
jgi:hypothetical protein